MRLSGKQGPAVLVATISVVLGGLWWTGDAQAAPRELNDAEMDEICAKGTTGFDVDLATIHEMVMAFSHHSAVAQVAGTILWTVEANTTDPAQVQVLVGSQPVTPDTPITPQAIQPIQIRAIDAAVRVTGDLNISVKTPPSITRVLERQQAMLAGMGSRVEQMLARARGHHRR